MFGLQGKNEEIRKQVNRVTSQICKDVMKQKGFFVKQQVDSFDNFIESDLGIKSIIQDMFRIRNTVLIEPTQIDVNGVRKIIKSIEIDIQFANVQIDNKQTTEEQIDLFLTKDEQKQKQKFTTTDTQIPAEARLSGKSLKINILSDILIKLTSYSEEYLEGEVVEQRLSTMKNQIVAQIPLMVGSKFCILSDKSKEQRALLQEDILDMGGFFILRGSEWAVDLTESIKFNEIQLWYTPKKKTLKGFVISKGGDAYQSSFQVTIEFKYKEGQITATLEYERIQFVSIPFFLIFKIFGITDEVEMMEMITQDDINSQDKVSLQLQSYIQAAVDNKYELFEDIKSLQTTEEVLQKMADVLNSEYVRKKQPDLTILNYTPQRVRDTFMIYFLPHMGTTSFENDVKMRYFADLLRKVLLSYKSGIFPDQHTYLEKRIHATGQNMAKMFKKSFNHQVIAQLRMKLIKELQKTRNIHTVEVEQMIQTLLANNIQNKVLQKSIITGSGADIAKGGKQILKGRIQSQKINRKNIINSIATMRMINNQKQSLDKQSKKIIEQRSVQPSFAGYICVIQSADNGDKAGKVKSLASLSMITTAQSSEEVIKTLWDILGEYIYEIGTFQSKDIKKYGLSKIFVNGYWVGFVQSSEIQESAKILRQYRKDNYQEWKYITVYINEQLELHIYSDFGRILTPMIIIHYDEQGEPFVNINEKTIDYILSGKADVDWYLEQQILEYISVEEAHNCLVAESPNMYIYKNQPQYRDNMQTKYDFTHIFIPQSLLGIVALLSPFANHAQTKRITMFTNQAKQGCGWAMYNYPFRMDKGMIVQQYVSSPLVRTLIHDFFPPNGQQIIVAYTMYDGFNQEDSVIINRGSIDNGLFNAVYYTYEETQIKYNEFVNTITGVQPPNQYGNFLKLQDGIIQKGIWIEKDDVLVAKKEQNRGGEPQDTSLIYKGEEQAYVEDVVQFYDEQYVKTIRVKLKIIRNVKQGDKFSSGQGCKAIVSKILHPSQMPFTEDGVVPDLIFNPHSVPTRMMIGQLLEATFQRICIEMCDTFDATVFSDVSNELAEELMKEFEIEDHGYQYLYNGDTGERIKSKIFICPTFYYRLQKFVIASKYVVNQGAVDVLTRQPVNNRKAQGGQRLGEMEKDTLYSSCTAATLREKFYDCSDGCQMYVCRNCGNRADFNPSNEYHTYSCSVCKENVDIVQVDSAWSSNILVTSLNSMNIAMTMEIEKPVIQQQL